MLKTFIIGLDGATFDLLTPWIKQGQMPTLAKLMRDGISGELQTVFPPLTPAAWSSFLTGKNPGKHGVYDFFYREEKRYTGAPHNRTTRRSPDFWEILNDYGLKVGLINVPMTYPPTKIDGYMLTGLMTPRTASADDVNYVYPESLKSEIKSAVGTYMIHPKVSYRKGKAKMVYDALIDDLCCKCRTVHYLIEKHPTDVTMCVINGTDKILHDLYHLIDPSHFRHDRDEAERDAHLIVDYYRCVDRELGILIGRFCNDDTLILIISDHGNGPLYKWMHVNNWLMAEGYLTLKKDIVTRVKYTLFRMGYTPANVYKILLQMGFSKAKISVGARDRLISRFFLSWDDIDWKKTRAYSRGHTGQIFINRVGREPNGIVSDEEYPSLKKEIEGKLRAFYDNDGTRLVDRILQKDEVYNGPYTEKAADILFMPYRMECQALGVSGFISNRIIEPSFGNTADHRMNGIFIMKGKHIRKGEKIKGARIVDIIPNLLFYHSLPIDEDMDGSIIKPLYEPRFFASQVLRYASVMRRKEEKAEAVYSDNEEIKIKKTLENLGYFG